MPAVHFSHSYVGSLTIDTGIDDAEWGYGLNTQSYPTYGGEVVQILSVYIDDLTLSGTVSTYRQLESIYNYFATYLIAATQGSKATPLATESYNLDPMIFTYPKRNWTFYIYPKGAPGFTYEMGAVGPQWQIQAHVIDDSPDLSLIKDGIKGMAVKGVSVGVGDFANQQVGRVSFNGYDASQFGKMTGNLSPDNGNPNSDPFQTDDPTNQKQVQEATDAQISNYADFYNSLVSSYMKGNFSSITGVVGSSPNFGKIHGTNQSSVRVHRTKKK